MTETSVSPTLYDTFTVTVTSYLCMSVSAPWDTAALQRWILHVNQQFSGIPAVMVLTGLPTPVTLTEHHEHLLILHFLHFYLHHLVQLSCTIFFLTYSHSLLSLFISNTVFIYLCIQPSTRQYLYSLFKCIQYTFTSVFSAHLPPVYNAHSI